MRVLAGHASYQQGATAQAGPRLTPAPTRFMTVVGIPKTIALQYSTGRRVKSRYPDKPDQVMYTLTTGERAYFDLQVAEAIDSLTLAPGQPFTVCHHGGGSWDIDRAHPQQATPQQPTQPAPAPPPPPPPAARETRYAPFPDETNQRMNGAGEDTAQILTRCYASAIEITRSAVEAARAKGLQFMPSHEGLQACAATLFIAETRRQS